MLDFLLFITLLLGKITLSSKLTKDKKLLWYKRICVVYILKNYNYKDKDCTTGKPAQAI